MVPFKEKVEEWEVKAVSPETRSPATLPDLIKKGKGLEAAVAANKKEAGAYQLEHAAEYNRYVDIKDKSKLPANLQKFAADWTKFEQTDKDLRRQISENKAAMERERRNTQLSVGQLPDLDTLTGEVVEKSLDLALTVNGQVREYTMGLRKYELQGGQGRMVSRWVVQTLRPK
jgi:hypothetical protein